jgi:hypothetical protein
VRNYKYLGVNFDDALNMSLDLSQRQIKRNKLKTMSWILSSKKFDGSASYHLWQAIFKSTINYATNVITIYDKKTKRWFESYLYESIKQLLGIKDKVSQKLLHEICLGMPFDDYMANQQQNTLKRMLSYPVKLNDQERIKEIKTFSSLNGVTVNEKDLDPVILELPLKLYLQNGLSRQLKWKLGFAFNLRGPAKQRCPCDGTTPIQQSHLTSCPFWHKIMMIVALEAKLSKEDMLTFLKRREPIPEDDIRLFKLITTGLNREITRALKSQAAEQPAPPPD